ncbi:MAG: GMC family oxidoreductase [Hyphomicrobiales bacterium]
MAYDYIITGAGSAGCVLAARLTEDPEVKVLLIEAGGSDRHPFFHMPAGFAKMTKGIGSWGWSTVPQRHMKDRVLWYTQAKVLGGGSSINAQIFTRGNPKDYDEWSELDGCKGWSFRDILPYFKRSEDNQRFSNAYHGTGGPLGVRAPINPLPINEAFIRAGQEYGLPYNPDFNGATQLGVGHYQITVRNARRSSTAVEYLRPARQRGNLTVITGRSVTRIIVEKGRAVGVELGAAGGATETIRCERDVIVSSGTIGSARLLMLSGIGPADHLTSVGVPVVHDLPGVGSNLQDHLDLYVIAECTGSHTYDSYASWYRALGAGIQYLLYKKGPVASTLFETGAFAYADDAARSPDVQFHLGLGSGIEAGVAKLKNNGLTLNAAFIRPRSRGSVRLGSNDPATMPLIDPNYFADPYDREISIKGLRIARELLQQPALKPFLLGERLPGPELVSDEDLFDYACRSGKTQHHPVGTCRMGHDAMAVVSPDDLRVHGISGLRVCDASIMPRLVSSNTNAATIMAGEKGSDIIRGRKPLPAAVLPPN